MELDVMPKEVEFQKCSLHSLPQRGSGEDFARSLDDIRAPWILDRQSI